MIAQCEGGEHLIEPKPYPSAEMGRVLYSLNTLDTGRERAMVHAK